jgi:hypothetical protein
VAADLSPDELRQLARLGAQRRLEELRQEEAAIRAAFPDLDRPRSGRGLARRRRGAKPAGAIGAAQPAATRRRRTMNAAQRRAVSERMKKYWAARRKAKG